LVARAGTSAYSVNCLRIVKDERQANVSESLAQEYLSDDEYAARQQSLVADPEAGDTIPGSGEEIDG